MSGSSNGAGAAQRAMALKAARESLSELHRALIEAARIKHEAGSGPVSPGELLRLLTTDEGFAWIHPVSELLADLDALQGEQPTEDLAAAARKAGESLLIVVSDPPSEFRQKYAALLQSNPSVAVAHGRLRQVLSALPAPSSNESDTLHERHQKALERKRRK